MFGQNEETTLALARVALDAASLRHEAISHNIANVNSPGFRPLRVDFERQLDALRGQLNSGAPLAQADLAGLRPVLERGPAPLDGDRSALLDMEVAAMAQNTVHYQALLKALDKHLAIIGTAVNEGKR